MIHGQYFFQVAPQSPRRVNSSLSTTRGLWRTVASLIPLFLPSFHSVPNDLL